MYLQIRILSIVIIVSLSLLLSPPRRPCHHTSCSTPTQRSVSVGLTVFDENPLSGSLALIIILYMLSPHGTPPPTDNNNETRFYFKKACEHFRVQATLVVKKNNNKISILFIKYYRGQYYRARKIRSSK